MHRLLCRSLLVIVALTNGTGLAHERPAHLLHDFSAAESLLLFTTVGHTLFFVVRSGESPPYDTAELWRSDGTADGTTEVVGSFYPLEMIEHDGSLYFRSGDFFHLQNGLWRVAPNEADPIQLSGLQPLHLIGVDDQVYFSVGSGIFTSDGTSGGTTPLVALPASDPCTGPGCVVLPNEHGAFVRAGARVLLITVHDQITRVLWEIDPTRKALRQVGTFMEFSFIGPQAVAVDDALFIPAIYYTSFPTEFRSEIWRTNDDWTTLQSVHAFKDLTALSGDIGIPTELTGRGTTLFFSAGTDAIGRELWTSHGTEAGTQPVLDINPGTASAAPAGLIDFNGVVLFSAATQAGREIWRSNGTAAGTMMVADINPGAASAEPSTFTRLRDGLLFAATDPSAGRELWRTDGTPAGTQRFADVNAGVADANPENITVVGNRVLFSAAGPDVARGLWSIDVPPCPGDCNDDGIVSIDELITGINVVLERRQLNDCPLLAVGSDEHIQVQLLVRAVDHALHGCP